MTRQDYLAIQSYLIRQAICILTLAATASLTARADAPSPSNTLRIVFLGDSITEEGMHNHGYIRILTELIHDQAPRVSLESINAGVRGNTIQQLTARADRDVVAHRPDLVTVLIGANDATRMTGDEAQFSREFEIQLNKLLQALSPSKEVVLMTPLLLGELPMNDADKRLDSLREKILNVGESKNILVCDTRATFKAAREQGRSLTRDGVHLNAEGNMELARTLNKCLARSKTFSRFTTSTAE